MIGWIGLNQRELRRIEKRLAVTGAAGTVDELGLGSITDVIAHTLFPAFTTLMTRARYFIFFRAVVELAAKLAWQRVEKQFPNEELQKDNPHISRLFKKSAIEFLQQIELSVCIALAMQKQERSYDFEEDAMALEASDDHGIIGIRKVSKKIRHGGLPRSHLFAIQERYPSSLYFTGVRSLGAFNDAAGIGSMDDLWSSYLNNYFEEALPIWDEVWRAKTDDAAERVFSLYQSYISALDHPNISQWERFDHKLISLTLTAPEAQLLAERLQTLGTGKLENLRRGVARTFLDQRETRTRVKGYSELAKSCRTREAKSALAAASDAMQAMHPVLTLYRRLSLGLDPGLGQQQRKDFAIQAFTELDFRSANAALKRLAQWHPPGNVKLGKARSAIMWLSSWLARAQGARSNEACLAMIRDLARRENRIVRARGKTPRLAKDSLSLTKERGVKELRARTTRYDEANPPEARSPQGRLIRAIRIYADIRLSLHKSKPSSSRKK